jgi:hypothetical protein
LSSLNSAAAAPLICTLREDTSRLTRLRRIASGSNMSGKSTFLRTVGVNAVLAQTINTCLASRYEAPFFAVRTCMAGPTIPRQGKAITSLKSNQSSLSMPLGRESRI